MTVVKLQSVAAAGDRRRGRRQALARGPADAETLDDPGNALRQVARIADAAEACREALSGRGGTLSPGPARQGHRTHCPRGGGPQDRRGGG